jgi:hypothetical protein
VQWDTMIRSLYKNTNDVDIKTPIQKLPGNAPPEFAVGMLVEQSAALLTDMHETVYRDGKLTAMELAKLRLLQTTLAPARRPSCNAAAALTTTVAAATGKAVDPAQLDDAYAIMAAQPLEPRHALLGALDALPQTTASGPLRAMTAQALGLSSVLG